jgi:GNAT superfamily N-acetyltransferase
VPEIPATSLRHASEDDTAFLLAVYASTRAEELALTDWTSEQKAHFCALQFEAQSLHYRTQYPTAQYDIILCGDTPAGRLYVDHWAGEIRIMDIALMPDFRGKGIGSYWLRDLQQQAQAAGKTLTIHVESFNPALQLYLRLGFRLTENKGVYQFMTWMPETALTAT